LFQILRYSLALAVPVVVWRRIPMTTRFRAGLPTYMREILRLGGAKLASQLVLGIVSHDFSGRDCYVVGNAVRIARATGALKSERNAG
jgi:hypothetical protein